MQSIKRMVYKPKVDDWSPMAKFYHANEALAAVTAEMDSFDSRREPERSNRLVNRLRHSQDRLLQVIDEMLLVVWPNASDRAPRDYRVKFPDDILQDNLPGQLWFGAECLASGSNIIDHEMESEAIRPLARALVRHIDQLRTMLCDQAIKNPNTYPEKIRRGLQTFDFVLAEFELNYVSAMMPVKSAREYEAQLEVAVLFSETLIRAKEEGLITEDQIDMCDPSVMVTLPRLAIVCGLLYYPDGPLNVNRPPDDVPVMFRTYNALLTRIGDLLPLLTPSELNTLERSLASAEEQPTGKNVTTMAEYKNRQNKKEQEGMDRKRSQSDNMLISHTQDNSTKQCSRSPSPVSDTEDGEVPNAAVLIDSGMLSPPRQTDSPVQADQKSPVEPYIARRQARLRRKFKSSEDMVHRLFVCIAGVADQLQVNNPSDLRAILKMVMQPMENIDVYEEAGRPSGQEGAEEELGLEASEQSPTNHNAPSVPIAAVVPGVVRWVPDSECVVCTACQSPFTFTRRRHHCRNCGRIFCALCSSNFTPIPELGYERRVRVCNPCQLYRVNHFNTTTDNVANNDVANVQTQSATSG